MTPFDSWYAAHIEANLPRDYPAELRRISKQQAANIWNAALDAVPKDNFEFVRTAGRDVQIFRVSKPQIEDLRARVTP